MIAGGIYMYKGVTRYAQLIYISTVCICIWLKQSARDLRRRRKQHASQISTLKKGDLSQSLRQRYEFIILLKNLVQYKEMYAKN